MHDYEFTLYVSRQRGGGRRAINSVQRLCELHCKENYKLTIIDMEDVPHEAERDHVLATPALVVHKPLPEKQVIGCFENPAELARVMGIAEGTAGSRDGSRLTSDGKDSACGTREEANRG